MTNRRHQSVISTYSNQQSDDHWMRRFESQLQKTSVQPYSTDQNLYRQINTIMNGSKAKYPSVQAAVDDMMHRSGLNALLDIEKQSAKEPDPAAKKSIAQEQPAASNRTPEVMRLKPSIRTTLDNIIQSSRGNLSIPTIISRLHSLHASDISDESAWEDERLIHLVSLLNLEAKKNNPANYDSFSHLGKSDTSTDIDASNTDAFHALMPAKM